MQCHGIFTLWRSSYYRASLPRRIIHRCTRCHVSTAERPFRLAIVGSGPAGFYGAARVMSKIENAVVDMYEQLPVPFGLVRYGVAPDHPEVKNCQDRFTEVASSPNFNFIGNVGIGHDISIPQLRDHYNAILFAYGASKDRFLNLSDEPHLKGLYSARAFVGWYNGLPEFTDLEPDLYSDDIAVIIGQGNVAIDVARILLTDIKDLQKTDISAHALEALSRSKIKRVYICGRRGPMQASFTIKEARELLSLPITQFLGGLDKHLLTRPEETLPRVQQRMADLLLKHTMEAERNASKFTDYSRKRWSLDFFREPEALLSKEDGTKLRAVRFRHTHFAPGENPFSPKARVERVHGTESGPDTSASVTDIRTSCCFRSIGYKSEPLRGMKACRIPFDNRSGTIVCDEGGRIIDLGTSIPSLNVRFMLKGMYCAGWVKSGPTGVIAASMEDAFATADSIVTDWKDMFENKVMKGWDALKGEVEGKGVRSVSWEDWLKIDRVEREEGGKVGKPREKFVRVEDMLRVLD